VELTGYICKKPTIRTTPSGKQVSDLLIACNFGKDKTAYIPAITWGKQARKSGKYLVGDEVSVVGRLQSRKYNKVIDENGTVVERVAYELSVYSIKSCHDC
jgi:single-stranded DNA-binding protein